MVKIGNVLPMPMLKKIKKNVGEEDGRDIRLTRKEKGTNRRIEQGHSRD